MSRSMSESEIKGHLAKLNAVRTDDHFVYTSGRHGHTYVDKNRIFLDAVLVNEICESMADLCMHLDVDIVAGPEKGGIVLANLVARYLPNKPSNLTGPWSIFLEKEDAPPTLRHRLKELVEATFKHFNYPGPQSMGSGVFLQMIHKLKDHLDELLDDKNDPKIEGTFKLNRGYDKVVKGKKVLITEDVLTTGGSVAKSITAIQTAGGEVVGVVAICNRGGVTAEQFGVPLLAAFMNIDLPSWTEDECPMCKEGKPINEEVGHGKEYMDKKRAEGKT